MSLGCSVERSNTKQGLEVTVGAVWWETAKELLLSGELQCQVSVGLRYTRVPRESQGESCGSVPVSRNKKK